MADDERHGQSQTMELLSLPVELRECIYEHYLANLQPATFTMAKNPSNPHWTLLTKRSRYAPTLLLVCNTISAEFQKVILRVISHGPVSAVSLSHGPVIRVEPRWCSSGYRTIDDGEHLVEQNNLPDTMVPILSHSAPSLRLHLVMPQSPVEATMFTSILRFISAVCNTRYTPLKHVRAMRDPVSGPGWAVDINAVAEEVRHIGCESMAWENWYQQWFRKNPSTAGENSGRESEGARVELSVDEAWEKVLESCREHEWP